MTEVDVAFKKLEKIYRECSREYQKNAPTGPALDDFAKIRRSLHLDVKEARKV
jgi:hypothetical protein